MRAIWITRHGSPDVLEVRETDDPELEPGFIRVRAHACGLNFAEMMARQGMYPGAPKPPCVVGYEFGGVVEALGDGVEGPPVGTRVIGLTVFGGHSDTVVTRAEAVRPIPDAMSFEQAAAIPVNYITAYLMLFRVGYLRPGARVLIHMAGGGVGIAALQLCRTVDGVETFGTASPGKHDFLRGAGLDHPIDYRSDDYAEVVRELTGGKGVDLILDPLGGKDWKKGLDLLRATGMLIAFGFANMAKGERKNLIHVMSQALRIPLLNPLSLMNQNKSVGGFHLGRLWKEPEMVGEALDALIALFERGAIAPQIDRIFSFEDAPAAHRRMQERQNIGKIILTP
jgi:NADPH:quinone reductase-like Zn-dependent oxidoreductase